MPHLWPTGRVDRVKVLLSWDYKGVWRPLPRARSTFEVKITGWPLAAEGFCRMQACAAAGVSGRDKDW